MSSDQTHQIVSKNDLNLQPWLAAASKMGLPVFVPAVVSACLASLEPPRVWSCAGRRRKRDPEGFLKAVQMVLMGENTQRTYTKGGVTHVGAGCSQVQAWSGHIKNSLKETWVSQSYGIGF